jgi:hypothetical protein
MAHKQLTFTERLKAAGGVVALYDQTQQARAVLALLSESASDESDVKDGLSDLARYLFGEIVLQAKPLNRDDHDGIFDATDFDWSERLRALHSLAAPLASAHALLLKLLADLEAIEIDGKDLDLVTHLREQVIQFINPATVDQVRQFPRALQGLGLVHLLDQYKVSPRIPAGRIQEVEFWIFTFLESEAREIAEVLADSNIRSGADLVDWGRKRKYAALAGGSQVSYQQ